MTDTTRTHRCIDCAQHVEHIPGELCGACGRCWTHCHELARGKQFVELTAQVEAERMLGEGKVV